jgi:hypothetical protein
VIDPISEEERKFRLDRWDKHTLTERQKMGTVLGSTNPRLAEEAEQINQLDHRILCSPYFTKLTPNEQQSVRYSPKWTSIDVLERAEVESIDEARGFCELAARFGEMFLVLTLDAFGLLNTKVRDLIS